jgi:hypothetical protein
MVDSQCHNISSFAFFLSNPRSFIQIQLSVCDYDFDFISTGNHVRNIIQVKHLAERNNPFYLE